MSFQFQGFILSCKHFNEQAGLVCLLTPQGVKYVYDKDFYAKYQKYFPYMKETLFAIEVFPGSDEHRFYLRELDPIVRFDTPNQYTFYLQWLISLALLTQKTSDHPAIFFKCYYRFMQQLQENPKKEMINFSLVYIELHVLVSMGSGDFMTHFEAIVRLKGISMEFHDFFLNKLIDDNDFIIIQEYIGQIIYDFYSWNKGFDVFKECLQVTQQITQ
ncbi:hypothetical protein EBS02_05020 [bacterium]|nr:hypothetical protein [bacterium]